MSIDHPWVVETYANVCKFKVIHSTNVSVPGFMQKFTNCLIKSSTSNPSLIPHWSTGCWSWSPCHRFFPISAVFFKWTFGEVKIIYQIWLWTPGSGFRRSAVRSPKKNRWFHTKSDDLLVGQLMNTRFSTKAWCFFEVLKTDQPLFPILKEC